MEIGLTKQISIRRMTSKDINEIRNIERLCFKDLWPSDSFERELKNRRVAYYIVARLKDKVIGYMGAWIIMDEAHITTLGVDPQFQNQKVAFRLIFHLMDEAVRRGIKWATLEVGEKNAAALRLYGKFGFGQIGIRKNYYQSEENALVMWVGGLQKEAYRKKLDELKSCLKKNRQAISRDKQPAAGMVNHP